jgi:predicted O-methyltransferase YrrM
MKAGIFKPTLESKAAVKFIEEIWPDVFKNEIVLSNLSYHAGCVRYDEIVFLASIVKHLSPRKIFEFGTCKGRTTLNMAANADHLETLYTLNLNEEQIPEEEIEWLGQDYALHQENRSQIGVLFRKSPHREKIVQLWGDSSRFDFSAFREKIDLALIDASKHYKYVSADSENAYRMLAPGGVLIWHDYDYADGVTKGVDDFAGRNNLELAKIHKTTLAVCIK